MKERVEHITNGNSLSCGEGRGEVCLIRFDWAMKRLLRQKANYVVLEGFLTVVLGEKIKILSIEDSESNQANAKDKFNRVDIIVKNDIGQILIVELQNSDESDYFLRMLYGVSKAITERMKKGDKYHLLQPVYTLSLINDNFSKSESYYHHYKIINREDTGEVIPGLEFVIVELTDKFYAETIEERKLMILWLRFLKETNEKLKELPDELQENEHISKAAELCEIAAFTPEELQRYNAEKEYIRIESALIEGSKRDALAEGEAKGEAKATKKFESIIAQKDHELTQKDKTIIELQKKLKEIEKQSL